MFPFNGQFLNDLFPGVVQNEGMLGEFTLFEEVSPDVQRQRISPRSGVNHCQCVAAPEWINAAISVIHVKI